MLALIRPDDWNLPLFFHVAGAMALVGALIVSLYALRIARAQGTQPAAQFAFRTLVRGVLPSYIVMRVFAQIVESKEDQLTGDEAWLGIGYAATDAGLLLLIVALVTSGLAARKAKAGESVAGSGGLRAAGVMAGILLTVYVVAIWAMTTKPS